MSDRLVNLTRVNHARRGGHTVFGEAHYGPGGICGPRTQRDWQIVILLSGQAVSRVGDEHRPFRPGMAALQEPGQRETVAYDPRQPSHHTWVAVRPAAVPPALAAALRAAPRTAQVSDALSRIMDAVKAQPRSPGPWCRAWVDQMGVAALTAYLCMIESPEDARPRSAVDLAMRHMEEHLTDPRCLRAAAKAASVTPQHLARRFQAEVGQAPAAWLWQLRLERASDMLLHSGHAVGDVARRCGFSTAQHFSRRFSAHFGASPARYRQAAWDK